MSPFTVLFDACVLYPAPLRSLLMYLAMTGLFRARWPDAIHKEWMRTANLRDFPADVLQKHGIVALHPDHFITLQLDLAPNVVCSAARKQRESLKNPPKSVDDYLESLERQGLVQTVASLRRFLERI